MEQTSPAVLGPVERQVRPDSEAARLVEYLKGYSRSDGTDAAIRVLLEQADEIERLRADRDCEKRMRKDSDDLATDLRLALEAVIAIPSDTGLAHAALKRIHGPNV